MIATLVRTAVAPGGQLSWVEAFALAAGAIILALPLIVGLYLVKSAMGINLMQGPSPLHDLFYQFVS